MNCCHIVILTTKKFCQLASKVRIEFDPHAKVLMGTSKNRSRAISAP